MKIPFKLLALLGVLILNCNICSLPSKFVQINSSIKTLDPTKISKKPTGDHSFSNADLSLSYPDDFYRFNEIWPDLGDYVQHNPEYGTDEILNIGNSKPGSKAGYTYRIAVMQRAYTPDLDMEQVYKDAYSTVRKNYPDREFIREDISLAGKDAVKFTLQRPFGEPWWRLRDIWVINNQSIYIFTYWAYPNHFDDGLHFFEETLTTIHFVD